MGTNTNRTPIGWMEVDDSDAVPPTSQTPEAAAAAAAAAQQAVLAEAQAQAAAAGAAAAAVTAARLGAMHIGPETRPANATTAQQNADIAAADGESRRALKRTRTDMQDTPEHAATPPVAQPAPPSTLLPITPAPAGGFPRAHFNHPEAVVDNLALWQAKQWNKHEGPKGLAEIWGEAAPTPENSFDRVEKIKVAIEKATGIRAAISPPTPHYEVPRSHSGRSTAPPYSYLIHGITEGELAALVDQHVIDVEGISLFVYPYGPVLSEYMCSIRNFIDLDSVHVRQAITFLLKENDLTGILKDLIARDPALKGTDHEKLASQVADGFSFQTLATRAGGGITSPTINLYLPVFTGDSKIWQTLREKVRAFNFAHGIVAPGARVIDGFKCQGCHGNDHPTGLCPFPQIPGWKGEPLAASPSTHNPDPPATYSTVAPTNRTTTDRNGARTRGNNRPNRGRGTRNNGPRGSSRGIRGVH